MLRFAGRVFLSLTGSGLLGGGLYLAARLQANPVYSAPALPAAAVSQSDTFVARGVVEPERENTTVGSAVAGTVAELFVTHTDLGQPLKAGTPLFRVDDQALQQRLQVEESQLTTAEAQLARLEAVPRTEDLAPLEARVRTAQANVAVLDDGFQRAQQLHAKKALAEEEFNQRKAARDIGHQQLAQCRAELELLKAGASEHDRNLARAQVKLIRAQAEQTRGELQRTLVRAPVDGTLLQLNIRVGEYVGTPPNQPLVVLGHPGRLQLRVEIDERDLPRFDARQAARASLPGRSDGAYPVRFVRTEAGLTGKRLLASDADDCQALQAVYALDAGDAPLYPGQRLEVVLTARPATVLASTR